MFNLFFFYLINKNVLIFKNFFFYKIFVYLIDMIDKVCYLVEF